MNVSETHKTAYIQEAQDLIADIETNLLDIEKDPGNAEALNSVFRYMHTIKGSGAMFGFDNIAGFAHHLETVLEKTCKGIVPVTQELIDLILISLDQIEAMLSERKSEPADQETRDRIVEALNVMVPEQEKQGEISFHKDEASSSQISSEESGAYCIKFRPEPDIFARGSDPLMLLGELRELGHSMVEPHTENIPALRQITPDQCYLSWDITLITDQSINDIKEVFMFVEENTSIRSVEKRKKEIPNETANALLKLCEELLEDGFVTDMDFNKTTGQQEEIGDLFVKAGITPPEEVKSGLDTQKLLDRKKTAVSAPGIRVPLEKMDILVNLVGELIINQARLNRIPAVTETGLLKTAERLTGELRNTILSIRTVPIETTFGKFRRYVRDTARVLDKEIELVTEGGDTELDKTVIERLEDPMIHLIRNSIDHGIETQDEREKAGKPRKGTILILAAHKGSKVTVTIKDDGAGIDPERVRTKAIEKDLITSHTDMSEKEIYNLLFIHGFSTSGQVTDISGRGVGMDIIKRAVDSLRGTVRITSIKGRETAFHLSLPLTLAIIDGLLVEAAGNCFILPINSVDECIELTKGRIEKAHGRDMIPVRGELIPFIRLREIFDLPGQRPSLEQIAVVQEED
ncbi:MAG: chemotaxis protein CheA, partial [Desulfobacteraceae bacterium]|nr:chemotaxis protein CheA [Desulfobacteraceae bacterium]